VAAGDASTNRETVTTAAGEAYCDPGGSALTAMALDTDNAQKEEASWARSAAASACARAHAGPKDDDKVDIAAEHTLAAADDEGRVAGSGPVVNESTAAAAGMAENDGMAVPRKRASASAHPEDESTNGSSSAAPMAGCKFDADDAVRVPL
jgi:hypothetical protein